MTDTLLCSICIATYRRPELLRKLLTSLFDQIIPDQIDIEIIVVDNDPAHSAAAVCLSAAAKSAWPVHYYAQPEKNISLTRNLAVEHAKGEYVCFIDDDETADIEWIKNLLATQDTHQADGVFGRVVSDFPGDVPEWIRSCYIFNRPAPATGSEALSMRTGNCLVRREILTSIPGPFDPRYGTSGGEDSRLFSQLKDNGARFVNSYEALTVEFVPLERANARWLLKRAFRVGNAYTYVTLERTLSDKTWSQIGYFCRAASYGLASFLLMLASITNPNRRFHWLLKLAANIGKCVAFFGVTHREYA